MDPITATALISGGAGVLSQAGNIYSTVLTNKANKELAEYSYQKDVNMWKMQNAYNDPKEQQIRLQNAGLNPNLVYGSGSVTGNTSSQLPKYSAPRLEAPKIDMDFTPALQAYTSLKMNQAQVENTQAATDLLNSKIVEQNLNNTVNAYRTAAETIAKEKGYYDTERYWEHRQKYMAQETASWERQRKSQEATLLTQTLQDQMETIRQNAEISRIQAGVKREELLQYKSLNEYRKYGIGQNDPAYYRIATKMLEKLGIKSF